MAEQAWEDAREEGMRLSLLVFFFVLFLVIIVVNEITVFGNLALFFLVVLFIQIIGDKVHVHGVRLRHLEFGLTLRTTQDLAFFDFIFVHIDFGGTFWTTDHGVILRRVVRKVAVRGRPPPLCSVLYTAVYEVNSRARCGCLELHCAVSCKDLPYGFFQRVPRKTGGRNRRRDHRSWPRPLDPPRERAFARRVVHSGRHAGAWRNAGAGSRSRASGRNGHWGSRARVD